MFTHSEFTPKRRVARFVRIKGHLVRDTSGKEVTISCAKLGSSMERFHTGYPIGWHKWH